MILLWDSIVLSSNSPAQNLNFQDNLFTLANINVLVMSLVSTKSQLQYTVFPIYTRLLELLFAGDLGAGGSVYSTPVICTLLGEEVFVRGDGLEVKARRDGVVEVTAVAFICDMSSEGIWPRP